MNKYSCYFVLIIVVLLSCDNTSKDTNQHDKLIDMNLNKYNIEFLYKIPWKKDGFEGRFFEIPSPGLKNDLPPTKIRTEIKLRFFDERLYLWEKGETKIYTLNNDGDLELFFEIPEPKLLFKQWEVIDFIVVNHQQIFSIDLFKKDKQRFSQLRGFEKDKQLPFFLTEASVERILYSSSGKNTYFQNFLKSDSKILVQGLEKNTTTVYELMLKTDKIAEIQRFQDVENRIFYQKNAFGFVTKTQNGNNRKRIWQITDGTKRETPIFNETAFSFLANPIQMDNDKNVFGVKPFEIAKINPQNEMMSWIYLRNVMIRDNQILFNQFDKTKNKFRLYNENGAIDIEVDIPAEVAENYTKIQLIEVDDLNQTHFIMYKKRQPYQLILSKNNVLKIVKIDSETVIKYPRVQSAFSWEVDIIKSRVLIPIQTEKYLYIGSIQL